MNVNLPIGRVKSALILAIVFFSLIDVDSSFAQSLPAFPGAEGFGSTSPGGRGGSVLFVTNLNDNGPGSFRAACLATGPRTIIFRVSGTIFLQSTVIVADPFLTIAGQTAPGGGICIANEALRLKTHDVVIRGMRFRPGDNTGNQHPLDIEALHLIGDNDDNQVYNVIADHCSFSWGIDKNVGCWAATFGDAVYDFTIQWSISSEALHSPYHPEGTDHSMAMFFSSNKRVSAHHNLLAHNHARQPQYSRNTWGEGINNVVYDYEQFATEVQSGAYVALISNYYKTGPSWNGHLPGINVDPPEPGYGNCKVYVDGNIGPGRLTDTGDDWDAVEGNEQYRVFSPPFALSGVVSTSAFDAYDAVLDGAGAFPRDAVDTRIISDVINGTGGQITSQDDVGGWPPLAQGTVPTDADNDGMPDDWEIANGLNPNNATDRNGDLDGDGYTNLEEYINGLILSPPGGGSGEPPVVSNIPNQTVSPGGRFSAFKVDDYVSDPDNGDSEITWTWTGNTSLIVQWDGVSRKIKVKQPNGWTGDEVITFTATDPEGNSDNDKARYTVTAADAPPLGSQLEEGEGGNLTILNPGVTALLENYPNPFNPSTTIRYELAGDTHVTLSVFDALGREVQTLVNGFVSAGYHEVVLDGSDLAGGMYFYRLTTPGYTAVKKFLLVK